MTQQPASCKWCGEPLPERHGPGRPREFCRRSHRQRFYEASLLAERMGLDTDEVLVARDGYESLRDKVYILEAALQDVERDLRRDRSAGEYRRAFQHLYAASAALRDSVPEPRAIR